MKIKSIATFFISVALVMACNKSKTTSTSFYVRGNCDMCKERIETAALELDGVEDADWDIETSTLTVEIDTTQSKILEVHQAVAKQGHGTKFVPMNQEAHDELPDCCKKEEAEDNGETALLKQ